MTGSEANKKAREDGVLFLPDSYLRKRGINPASVAPSWLAPKHVILEGMNDVGSISQVGGRAHKPGNVTLVGRPGAAPLMIVHDEQTEAAEIEDLVYEAAERKPIDFAESRERQGLPPKEQFDTLLRQAAEDHNARMRRNKVTARPRDPMQQYVKGLVTVPAIPGLNDHGHESGLVLARS